MAENITGIAGLPSVFFAGSVKGADGTAPQAIAVSTQLEESYTLEADVTQTSLEDGSLVSEHVILKPLKVEFLVEVSNWDRQFGLSAMESFINLIVSRVPVTLVTEHASIKQMVCHSVQPANTNPKWGSLTVRVGFTQVYFVPKMQVTVPMVMQASNAAASGQLPLPVGGTSSAVPELPPPPKTTTAKSAVPPKSAGEVKARTFTVPTGQSVTGGMKDFTEGKKGAPPPIQPKLVSPWTWAKDLWNSL